VKASIVTPGIAPRQGVSLLRQEICKVLILARNQENKPQRHYEHNAKKNSFRRARCVVVVHFFDTLPEKRTLQSPWLQRVAASCKIFKILLAVSPGFGALATAPLTAIRVIPAPSTCGRFSA